MPVFNALLQVLWEHCTYGGRYKTPRLDADIGRVVSLRLQRVREEVLRLIDRFRAGETLWRGPRPSGAAKARSASARDTARRDRAWCQLPRRHGWLLPLMPYEAAYVSEQMETALRDPEMVGVMLATPRVARCVDMALLLQPPDARVRVAKLRVRRPRRPRKPSYIDVEYRKREPGRPHWVLRVNKKGMRFKKLAG